MYINSDSWMGHIVWNDDNGVIEQSDDLKILYMVFLFPFK